MKFYDCQTAPSPRRVRMFISEKNLTIDNIDINLRDGEQLKEAFLAINPHATVPVLELDDGTRLTTTAGCRAYLEDAHPAPPMLGRNPVEKGKIADLIWRIENEAFLAVGEALRNRAKGMQGRALTGPHNYEQIPALAERGRERAQRFFPILDELIGNQEFVASDQITAADIDAFIFVEFATWIKLEPTADCTNLGRWHAAMAQRASAAL